MKADDLYGFNFLVYVNCKIQNKAIQYFSIIFLFGLELRVNYAPLTWYEQEYLRVKAHFWS